MNWLSRHDHGDITKSILSFIFAAFIRPTAIHRNLYQNSRQQQGAFPSTHFSQL